LKKDGLKGVKKLKFTRAFAIILCVLLGVGILACQKAPTKSSPAPSKTEKKANQEKATPEPQPPEKVYPLTGLPAKGPINQRVVGVMVNNYYLARPQSGLHKADIVYEALAEGRITRFLALFQSQQPEIIGPVRSARPYFIRLDQGYGGLYVSHGWSTQAKALLQGGGIDYIQGLYHDGTWFKRVTFRKAPHNSYIPYANIVKGAKASSYSMTQDVLPLPFLTQQDIAGLNGELIDKVTITYGSNNIVSYDYHPDTQLFYRHINGEQAKDRETGTPLTAANVFIVSASHRFIDKYPRREIDLKSGGPAYLLQHGIVQKVEWRNVDGRLLPYKNGKALGFVPGQTWINIVEASPGLDKEVKLEKKGS
jgi:hypothetical protein